MCHVKKWIVYAYWGDTPAHRGNHDGQNMDAQSWLDDQKHVVLSYRDVILVIGLKSYIHVTRCSYVKIAIDHGHLW